MSSSKRKSPRKEQKLQSFDAYAKLQQSYSNNISFSFEYFTGKDQNGVGQDFCDWSHEKLIDLDNKLKAFSCKTVSQMLSDATLAIYDKFTSHSEFVRPLHIPDTGINWARFRLSGKVRIIGFFLCNREKTNHDVFI